MSDGRESRGQITKDVIAVFEKLGEGTVGTIGAELPQYTEAQIRACLVNAAMRKTILATERIKRVGRLGTTPMVYRLNPARPDKQPVRKYRDIPLTLPVASVFEMGERIAANRPCWVRREARRDFATPEAA